MSALLERFERSDAALRRAGDGKRHFSGMYLRSTHAVLAELNADGFADGEWVERWDVDFAERYLDALDAWEAGVATPRPWRIAFGAAERDDLPPLRHQLVGLNAHLNFDLPQSVLALVTDAELADPAMQACRHRDFDHIDGVMLRRIPEEYRYLRSVESPGERRLIDQALYPLNIAASRRWLVGARRAVWRNAVELSAARRSGEAALAARMAELERLTAAKVTDLLRPGQVLLRLAVTGFGVALPARGQTTTAPPARSPKTGAP